MESIDISETEKPSLMREENSDQHSRPTSDQPESTNEVEAPKAPPAFDFNKPLKFWLIFVALCFSVLLSALDLTAVSTALPNIISDLHGKEYVWVGSAYALTSTAFLPWTGTAAGIFGRRATMLAGLAIFMLGSGLCGGSKSMSMLIAARSIQGVGGGAILSMTEIVVADLVALRERGAFMGFIGMVWALASAIGPLIGGALANDWKWLFYLNLPLGAVAMVLVLLFLDLKTPEESWRERVAEMNFFGNVLIIGSTTSVILGIVWGGSSEPWGSYKVLVPLIIGVAGTAVSFYYEFKRAKFPTIPINIVNNRTAIAGYFGIFMHGLVTMILVYYMPVYFQGVRGNTPIRSAIHAFSVSFTIAPFAIVAGISVQIIGKYLWVNYTGWILGTLGLGLLAILKVDSSKAVWVITQCIAGTGIGLLYTGLQFVVLAPTPPTLNAPALAFLTFARSYGQVFGVSIGASILNNQLGKKLPTDFRAQFGSTPDIAYSVIPAIKTLSDPLKSQVLEAFNSSLRLIWIICVPLAATGIIASFFMKEIPMEIVTDENWGMKEKKRELDMERGNEEHKAQNL